MLTATDRRPRPGRFWPLRGEHAAVELVIAAAIVLTFCGFYFRDTLTMRELVYTPAGEGVAYLGYQYDDATNNGTSTVAVDEERPLSWTCNLTHAFQFGYCGFGLVLDPAGAGGGVDLTRYDRMVIDLHYEGSAASLRFVLKNKDARYAALGAASDEQVNQLSAAVRPGRQQVEMRLDRFVVAEWWKDSAARPSSVLSEPAFNNVIAIEMLTAADSLPGEQRVRIDRITLQGRTVGAEAWYSGIALVWLLLIGAVMLQRRQETSKWREDLIGSMRTTVDTIPHMVWSLDLAGGAYFNRRWEEFTGHRCALRDRFALRRLIHPDDARRVFGEWRDGVRVGRGFDMELRVRHHCGDYRWVLARTAPSHGREGAITGWYGTCTDIDDRVRAQQALRASIEKERRRSRQLKWTSEHDPLTRLPNRRAFEARLAEVTQDAPERATETGLFLIDLDYFKHLNDTLGHGAGDELLRTIATRLKRAVRRQDFVARIGGDEFAVIVPQLREAGDLAALGNAVAAAIQQPLNIGGHVVRPGVSIGGAICPKDQPNSDDFLKRADAALYALKRGGRGGFRLFEGHMLDEVKTAAYQLARAREVIAEDTIVAHYQPKIAVRGGTVVGFEALLRCRQPDGTLELPETIAEAFNDYELAANIGEMIQHRVARDMRAWVERDVPFGRISINAAPAEFLRDDYAERLLGVLSSHGVRPDRIEVEVTEHALMERGREYVSRALTALKAVGVTVSLDDFGTGHSSLSHMRDFPVDLIKIDRSYTALIGKDDETAALVAGVIHLACSLGLEALAEGVETTQQLDLLRAMGCHYAQGHLLGAAADRASVAAIVAGDLRQSVA
jgi:diguanylate cyclase (GGDEF)-like protein/PAS domain S-box-containing protein